MRIRNSSQGYGAVALALHWLVAVLVLAAWLTGQFGDALPKGAARETGLYVHVTLGLAIVALMVVRLFWRLSDPPPAPEKSPFDPWAERAAKAVQLLVYALLVAIPAAGIVALFARGQPLPVFGLFEIASPWTADRTFAHDVTEIHETLANAMMVLVGLHALAALAHHYILRDRTLARMLPWARA
jgi:cytochrome b561